MNKVLTLIAAAAGQLGDACIARVRAALDRLGADTVSGRWLSPGRAYDLPFARLAAEQAEAAALAVLDGLPIDAVAQAAADRRKRLLVADMDSTIVSGESIDILADRVGRQEAIQPLTARAMNGQADFADSLRQRVALLAGLEATALAEVAAQLELTVGARQLVATMRAHGARTVLISGGFRQFTRAVAERCGFDAEFGNAVAIKGGRLTGTLVEPVLDAEGKLATLTRVAAAHKVPLRLALAVGDGANDLPMLQAAGLGVAFHAKPLVAAAVRTRIRHADLTALLYVQGYSDADISGASPNCGEGRTEAGR